jgi:putative transposase
MARKLRLEFPGASYHLINRGNYRAWIFKTEGARAAFERCLFDTCERCGWLLDAFVIMGNHYHLAVETPQGNLVAGMQWLQSTFANRFNQLRGEHGHLFQGRYKSLLVEPGDALGQVCHYIHLNPVRAGILPAGRLDEFRYSSYWYLRRPKERPACLRANSALCAAGDLPDRAAGWKCYADYLTWQAAEGPAGKNAAYASLSRGWAIGGEEFKQALLRDHAVATEARAWESEGVREVRAARWREALSSALACISAEARGVSQKSAPWKVAVAAHLKATTDVCQTAGLRSNSTWPAIFTSANISATCAKTHLVRQANGFKG